MGQEKIRLPETNRIVPEGAAGMAAHRAVTISKGD
jgi:hypothetical protein